MNNLHPASTIPVGFRGDMFMRADDMDVIGKIDNETAEIFVEGEDYRIPAGTPSHHGYRSKEIQSRMDQRKKHLATLKRELEWVGAVPFEGDLRYVACTHKRGYSTLWLEDSQGQRYSVSDLALQELYKWACPEAEDGWFLKHPAFAVIWGHQRDKWLRAAWGFVFDGCGFYSVVPLGPVTIVEGDGVPTVTV